VSESEPILFGSYPYWTIRRIIGLTVGILVIGGIGVFAYSQYAIFQSNWITVSGVAKTSFTSTVVWIQFTAYTGASCSPGAVSRYCSCSGYAYGPSCYTSYHTAPVKNGEYSMRVENHSGWTVFLTYQNYYSGGYYQTGQTYCYAGNVGVNSNSGTYIADVGC
jgi:hypothetical protein